MTTFPFDFQLQQDTYRLGLFLRLELLVMFRFWLGIGDVVANIDASDGGGSVYSGIGEILNLPAFSQVINGAADRFELKLSGVSARVANLAATQSDQVKGVNLRLGVGMFDTTWALIGNPVWLKQLIVDFVIVEGDQKTRTVGLSARTLFTGRRRPQASFFTNEDQTRISPGDRFCENTGRYTTGSVKTWPVF